jgi:hypothetical protein
MPPVRGGGGQGTDLTSEEGRCFQSRTEILPHEGGAKVGVQGIPEEDASVMPRLTQHKPRDWDHVEGAGGRHKGAGCQILGDESQSRTSHSGSKREDRLQVHCHRGEDKSSGEERPKVWTGRSCPTSTPFHDQEEAAKNRFRKIKNSCQGSKTDGKDGRVLQEGNGHPGGAEQTLTVKPLRVASLNCQNGLRNIELQMLALARENDVDVLHLQETEISDSRADLFSLPDFEVFAEKGKDNVRVLTLVKKNIFDSVTQLQPSSRDRQEIWLKVERNGCW